MKTVINQKEARRKRRHKKVRAQVSRGKTMPRLCEYRSNKHIYAQVIDDKKGVTLAAASDVDKAIKDVDKKKKVDVAKEVGTLLAKRSGEKKITKVAYDRGGFIYTGRVRALAEGARGGGLIF